MGDADTIMDNHPTNDAALRRSLASAADSLEDATAAIEHLLNVVATLNTPQTTRERSAPTQASVEAAERLIGVSWELLRLALSLLRVERTHVTAEDAARLARLEELLALYRSQL